MSIIEWYKDRKKKKFCLVANGYVSDNYRFKQQQILSLWVNGYGQWRLMREDTEACNYVETILIGNFFIHLEYARKVYSDINLNAVELRLHPYVTSMTILDGANTRMEYRDKFNKK